MLIWFEIHFKLVFKKKTIKIKYGKKWTSLSNSVRSTHKLLGIFYTTTRITTIRLPPWTQGIGTAQEKPMRQRQRTKRNLKFMTTMMMMIKWCELPVTKLETKGKLRNEPKNVWYFKFFFTKPAATGSIASPTEKMMISFYVTTWESEPKKNWVKISVFFLIIFFHWYLCHIYRYLVVY